MTIGGPVPSSTLASAASTPTSGAAAAASASPLKKRTPILALGGSSQTLLTSSAIADLKAVFECVEDKKWPRAGDGMPRSREEMRPVMEVFARRLRSRRGVSGGAWRLGSLITLR